MLWDRVLSLADGTAALYFRSRGSAKLTILPYTVHNPSRPVKCQWAWGA